jgi:multidrug efflux pump subunit AcrB
MVISLFSPQDHDATDLTNYITINLRDQVLRIPGVAQVDLFGGSDYSMRIWLKPDRMAQLGLTPADVISVIREQNLQAPAGQIGAAPSPKGQEFTYTVRAPGRLVTAEEFENIIIRQTQSGSQIRIKDVGSVELGAENYKSFGRLDGKPAGIMAVYLLPGANQLQVSRSIYETMANAKALFPPDMDYKIVYDTTPPWRLYRGDRPYIRRGDHSAAIVVFIFLELSGHNHSAACRAGFAHWTFIFFPMPISRNALDVRPYLAIASSKTTPSSWSKRSSPPRARMTPKATINHERRFRPQSLASRSSSAVFLPVAFLGSLTGRMHQPVRSYHRYLGAAGLHCAVALPALCAIFLRRQNGAKALENLRWATELLSVRPAAMLLAAACSCASRYFI